MNWLGRVPLWQRLFLLAFFLLGLGLIALILFTPPSPIVAVAEIAYGVFVFVSLIGLAITRASRPGHIADDAGSPVSADHAAGAATSDKREPSDTANTASSGGGTTMAPSFGNPTPFKLGWWSFDLGQYRPCDGTYCFYPYESLPPIRSLDGTLDWLGPLDSTTDQEMEIHRDRPKKSGQMPEIEAEAAQLGLTLPETFARLMGSPELQDRIPSCTACYFELSKAIVPSPGSQDGFIVRFLNDQQNVLTWYLYLTRDGASCVIGTSYWLEELTGVQGEDAPGTTMTATMGEGPDAVTWDIKSGPQYTTTADPQTIQQVIASTYVCAPSFDEFIYRWWLENTIWFKLNESDGEGKLTDEERAYLAHYRPAKT